MIKKTYFRDGQSCRVTFRVPEERNATRVNLVGEFNDWDIISDPMRKRRDGSFSLTLSLTPGNSYRFRYLVDDTTWENEPEADAYVPNPYGTEDSLIHV